MPRPNLPKDLRLVYKVSRLYYEQDVKEEEIASQLHLSRAKVSRLLKYARQTGVVQITVTSPPGIHTNLEQQIESKYGLEEVIVVEVDESQTQEVITRAIGNAAARYLKETLQDGDLIGISWGTNLNAMVAALQPMNSKDCRVLQIIGGLGPPMSEVHATEICRRMSGVLNCGLILLPAPGILSTRQAKEALLSDPHIQRAINLIPNVNIAYVGIGSPTPNSVLLRDGSIISQSELNGLLDEGAVGDIALRFFNQNGAPIRSELDERVIGITHEQIKRIKRVVGVSGGPGKPTAIRGALLGGYLKVLITDHKTAEALLQ